MMDNANPVPGIKDKGGRRLEIPRRRFFTLRYIHEKRSNQERRSGQGRRTRNDPGRLSYPRRSMDRYMEFCKYTRRPNLWPMVQFTNMGADNIISHGQTLVLRH